MRSKWEASQNLCARLLSKLIACIIAGSAEFQEREIGGAWLPSRVRRGDLFVTEDYVRAHLAERISIETLNVASMSIDMTGFC